MFLERSQALLLLLVWCLCWGQRPRKPFSLWRETDDPLTLWYFLRSGLGWEARRKGGSRNKETTGKQHHYGKKMGELGGDIKYQYLRLDYVLKQTMFKMHKEVSLEGRDRWRKYSGVFRRLCLWFLCWPTDSGPDWQWRICCNVLRVFLELRFQDRARPAGHPWRLQEHWRPTAGSGWKAFPLFVSRDCNCQKTCSTC